MAKGQKKIIAVDDVPENLAVIRNTLKSQYEVYPCPSTAKMFELLEDVKPDLFLLNVGTQDMDGFEAIKKLKSDGRFKEIPVIILSATDDEKSETEGLKLGAVCCIRKPFVIPLLLQRVKIHLSALEKKKTMLNRNMEIEDFLNNISKSPE